MKRLIQEHIQQDLDEKIVLLAGPRQVGKTTLSRQLPFKHTYLNFDASADRRIIMSEQWDRDAELVIFDELHKMKNWKRWLKGIYDTEGVRPRLMVTGSARMDTYRKSGDSLAGRHFLYRLHPFSLTEVQPDIENEDGFERLMEHGGFPEPFLRKNARFSKRWRKSHLDVILREDLLDLEKVRDIKSIEIMIDLLRHRVGATTSYSSLARDLQVAVPTVKHWLQILENLYVIFPVRPWHRNVARSLLKESKYFFYDTGAVANRDGLLENAVACHLQQALHFHEDTTGSHVKLCFMRDKDGREVDFLTVVDDEPRHLIEVKQSDTKFSKNLFHFQTFAPNAEAFQLVNTLEKNRSSKGARMRKPAQFLSQMKL